MTTSLAWSVRSLLSHGGRKRARWLADRLFAPLGSVNGARRPTQRLALTFDDGPDPIVTPALLDLLRARGVRATFFVLVDRAVRHPDLVARIVAEGHEIALHCDRHDRLTTIPAREMYRRIAAAKADLERIAARKIRYFRPPFGAQSLLTFLIARACGLEVVVWGPYAEDWAEAPPEIVAARGLRAASDGDVLLLHDGLEMPAGGSSPTFDRLRAFALILDGLEIRGIRGTSVGELTSMGGSRRTAWFRP